MKNLKFSYQEDKSNITYEEYYFNGIPYPKNIKFNDISLSSLKISWDIDNINIININNNNIKYKVEMRKKNKKFSQVYSGSDKNCLIKNLKKDRDYEFRVCSFYNNLIGCWSQINLLKLYFYYFILNYQLNINY